MQVVTGGEWSGSQAGSVKSGGNKRRSMMRSSIVVVNQRHISESGRKIKIDVRGGDEREGGCRLAVKTGPA